MPFHVRYIERKHSFFVSIEKVFREIAENLGSKFVSEFEQLPFSSRVYNILPNLIAFRRKPADIYHVTGHVHFICLRLPVDRTVLTIHDVRFLHENFGIKRVLLKKLFLDWPVRRIRYITSISSAVRDEIVMHTNCDPTKIRILDVPLASHFFSQVTNHFNSSKPLILQIGAMENKNILNLAKALSGIDCRLLIVGKLKNDQIDALHTSRIEFQNIFGVLDDEMTKYYQKADLITFCSTYEGFGLPIIEAQAMRKPVVTSNISPMKETAGRGAVLVDPFDPESIKAGIIKIIDNPEFRAELVEEGEKNVQRFLPINVAAQYERLYDEMIHDRLKKSH